ncbi:hypothetical protein Tco_0895549 [Tanacetum coccineum]|uniref:Uncharacterized protein n=1 Tax=Tanacetum coccineum TaxID=301880 RepID=A0ABQ5CGF3_9ASTR
MEGGENINRSLTDELYVLGDVFHLIMDIDHLHLLESTSFNTLYMLVFSISERCTAWIDSSIEFRTLRSISLGLDVPMELSDICHFVARQLVLHWEDDAIIISVGRDGIQINDWCFQMWTSIFVRFYQHIDDTDSKELILLRLKNDFPDLFGDEIGLSQ